VNLRYVTTTKGDSLQVYIWILLAVFWVPRTTESASHHDGIFNKNVNNDQIRVVPTLLSVLAYVFNVVCVMIISHKRRSCLLKLHLRKATCSENCAPEDNVEKYFPSFPSLKIAKYLRDENTCNGQ